MPWKNTGLRKRGTCASDKMQSDGAIVKELPELVTNAVVAVSKWVCLYDVLSLSPTTFFLDCLCRTLQTTFLLRVCIDHAKSMYWSEGYTFRGKAPRLAPAQLIAEHFLFAKRQRFFFFLRTWLHQSPFPHCCPFVLSLVNLGVTVIFYSLVVSVWTIIRDALLVGLATLGVTYAVFRAGKYIYVRRKVSDNIKRYPWHGWKCW